MVHRHVGLLLQERGNTLETSGNLKEIKVVDNLPMPLFEAELQCMSLESQSIKMTDIPGPDK